MPGLVDTLETFWEKLPAYQRLDTAAGTPAGDEALAKLDVSRVVYGWFPTYRRNSPLSPSFDRVLSIGDASRSVRRRARMRKHWQNDVDVLNVVRGGRKMASFKIDEVPAFWI